MVRTRVAYGTAEILLEFDGSVVSAELKGEKEFKLGKEKVPPLLGKFYFKPHEFIRVLEGIFGLEPVRVKSEEGVSLNVKYDWEGRKRGDDLLKVNFVKLPESRSNYYLVDFQKVNFTAFVIHVKNSLRTYAFRHQDLSFIVEDGELTIARGNEEIRRFSRTETSVLRALVENAVYEGKDLGISGVELEKYPKRAKFSRFPDREYRKVLLKLYLTLM